MNLNDYQERALTTAVFPKQHALAYTALGLAGESGEVADKVKKILRGDTANVDYDGIAKELGDVLWYLAVLSDVLGYNLSDIAQMNLQKLAKRQAEGTLKGSGDNR